MIKKIKIIEAPNVGKENDMASDTPKEVANSQDIIYKRDNFFVGQKVKVLDKISISDNLLVDDTGSRLSDDVIKKIRDIEFEINKLIDENKLEGTIFKIEGDSLILDLDKKYSFTSNVYPMDQVYPEREHFFIFEKKNCGYIQKDENKNDLVVAFISGKKNKSLEEMCYNYSIIKKQVINLEKNKKDYAENILQCDSSILIKNAQLKVEKEKIDNLNNGIETDERLYVSKIMKNPDVKDIKVVEYQGEKCLLVTTNPLEYNDTVIHDKNLTPFGFTVDGVNCNIGEYKFLIFKNDKPKATSTTKFLGTGQHHPCVSNNFVVCTGASFGDAYNKALKKGDIAACIHMMIDFLKDPNSTSPFIDSTNFLFMQDIPEESLKLIKDDLDFFNYSFYENLPFDPDLYKKSVEKTKEEIKKQVEKNEKSME